MISAVNVKEIVDKFVNHNESRIFFDKMVKNLNTDFCQQKKRCKFALFNLSLATFCKIQYIQLNFCEGDSTSVYVQRNMHNKDTMIYLWEEHQVNVGKLA